MIHRILAAKRWLETGSRVGEGGLDRRRGSIAFRGGRGPYSCARRVRGRASGVWSSAIPTHPFAVAKLPRGAWMSARRGSHGAPGTRPASTAVLIGSSEKTASCRLPAAAGRVAFVERLGPACRTSKKSRVGVFCARLGPKHGSGWGWGSRAVAPTLAAQPGPARQGVAYLAGLLPCRLGSRGFYLGVIDLSVWRPG